MKALAPLFLGLLAIAIHAQSPDLGGVKVSLAEPSSQAVITAVLEAPFKLKVSVASNPEAKPQTIRIDLPNTGPKVWPAADVVVRDPGGNALLVRRSGIEWYKLLVPLPAGVTNCIVEAIPPSGGWTKPTTEKDRTIHDQISGVKIRIAKWHDGRASALSIRFDDSHPTHLSKAAPILDSYGFRGTFMINPGAPEPASRRISEFNQQRAAWETLAKQGNHELANHSAHHRGGLGDADVEAEIGEAAQAIWQMTPGKSRLTALNLGGGTRWETTRSLRYYLDKYHHFDASENSTGMDDSYGNRVENFRRVLQQHLQRGLWCRIHYHYIGEGLSSSEPNFRAVMDIVKQHQDDLWIAGMAEIYKYLTERDAARLSLIKSDAQQLSFRLSCSTDAAFCDQPLTVEMVVPPAWKLPNIVIKNAQNTVIPTVPEKVDGVDALRFDVPPREADYSATMTP